MPRNIVDKLYEKMDEKKTPLCIGLDPVMEELPRPLLQEIQEVMDEHGSNYELNPELGYLASAEAIKRFNFAIIDATRDLVPAFKPQSAFYEKYGHWGIRALEETIKHARKKGAIVILDAKRNDIGKTATAYAEAHLGRVMLPNGKYARSPDDADFMTVNGYLGSDGIEPFAKVANRDGKGFFILAKTSNKSSGELQDILISDGEEVYMKMAKLISEWGKEGIGESGYSNVGAVVGATYPEEAKKLRKMLSHVLFLMPGYKTQGASAEDLTEGFDENGRGAIVNSSSGITGAFSNEKFAERHPELAKPEKFAEAARQSTMDSIEDINSALKKAGKLPKSWRI
ncbi:orotidine-5'-phosphate decarboxylase [Candidatus Pacearchaeota archaeon]|nr:orotidine-5'-phosphate decarboxylase [Candidatus Pacearchaeota archaeon]